jgi:hypothetical protein
MARRRYQKGNLRKRGKRSPVWELQWWEDYIRENGSIGRRRQSAVLGLVSDLTQRQARKLAEDQLRPVNQELLLPQSTLGFEDFVDRYFVPLFFPTLHTKTLPSNSNNSPPACFWKLSASRHRKRRLAAIRIARNGRRFRMGICQTSAHSRLQGLRTSEAVELLLGSQSRERCLASRESSGSRKARTDSQPYPWSSRIAQVWRAHTSEFA